MTLTYIRAIAEYCDRKFEFIPGMESFDLDVNEVRKELAFSDRVSGGTNQFCSFIYWQLNRVGIKSKIWFVADYKEKFFVLQVGTYFISYYDGRIYLEEECPWKPIKYTTNLKEWKNVGRSFTNNNVSTGKLFGYYNYSESIT